MISNIATKQIVLFAQLNGFKHRYVTVNNSIEALSVPNQH